MPDDLSDVIAYYNSDPQREHNRLERHQLEYELTWRYLENYLPPAGKILEIGAATGRYTLELARRGYTVTAVDLSAGLLAECRLNLERAGLQEQVTLLQADARCLDPVTTRDYDAALLMGPLYHLIEEPDRLQALAQVYARLRPGGVIFSAFISRYGILGDVLKDIPEWIDDPADPRALLATGHRPVDQPPGGFRGYFALAGELAPLHQRAGFETIAVAGVEPAISADDESYNRLQGPRRQAWLDLLYEVSTEPSILGASRHLLYLGRKPA